MLTMSKQGRHFEDRAIPLLNMFLSGLNRWLGLRAGLRPDDVICVDNDGVLALEPRRQTETNTRHICNQLQLMKNVQQWDTSLKIAVMSC